MLRGSSISTSSAELFQFSERGLNRSCNLGIQALVTGDLGSLDEENFLYIDGRIDDMIISGGINMMPSTIEDALLSHPGISEACVIGVPDAEWGQRVAAYLVPSDRELTVDALDQYVLDSSLSHYLRPRHYEFVDELPKGNGGKIDRRALKAQVVQAAG